MERILEPPERDEPPERPELTDEPPERDDEPLERLELAEVPLERLGGLDLEEAEEPLCPEVSLGLCPSASVTGASRRALSIAVPAHWAGRR